MCDCNIPIYVPVKNKGWEQPKFDFDEFKKNVLNPDMGYIFMPNPTKLEKALWNALATHVGCIACRIDGKFNDHCSIHHIDGRTKPDAHKNVLPLCAGHHQDGTGQDKTMIAVHPYKTRFEKKYGTQEELLEKSLQILKDKGMIR